MYRRATAHMCGVEGKDERNVLHSWGGLNPSRLNFEVTRRTEIVEHIWLQPTKQGAVAL
jgi:hypothetical protein